MGDTLPSVFSIDNINLTISFIMFAAGFELVALEVTTITRLEHSSNWATEPLTRMVLFSRNLYAIYYYLGMGQARFLGFLVSGSVFVESSENSEICQIKVFNELFGKVCQANSSFSYLFFVIPHYNV